MDVGIPFVVEQNSKALTILGTCRCNGASQVTRDDVTDDLVHVRLSRMRLTVLATSNTTLASRVVRQVTR